MLSSPWVSLVCDVAFFWKRRGCLASCVSDEACTVLHPLGNCFSVHFLFIERQSKHRVIDEFSRVSPPDQNYLNTHHVIVLTTSELGCIRTRRRGKVDYLLHHPFRHTFLDDQLKLKRLRTDDRTPNFSDRLILKFEQKGFSFYLYYIWSSDETRPG